MRRIGILVLVVLGIAAGASAQEFVPLYPAGKLPNSKGTVVKEDIRDERIYAVETPAVRVFLPSDQENKGVGVLICPGGGYARIAYMASGTTLAKWLNTFGVAAFVLDYRLPTSPDLKDPSIGPLQDAQRAMRVIRANAAKWKLDPAKIGVMGTSAGGHLAATLATFTDDFAKVGDDPDALPFGPNFLILVSPVITMGEYAHAGSKANLLGENPSQESINRFSAEKRVTSKTPPTFIVHAADDTAVNVRNSLMFHAALVEAKIPASIHVFPFGGHAIAVRNNPGSTSKWTELCEMWMSEMGILPDKPLRK